MKTKLLAVTFALLLVGSVMAMGTGTSYATITASSEVVSMGSSPGFSFRVIGYGTNLMFQPTLMKEGRPVGLVTYGSRSVEVLSSNEVAGQFTWGLTRVIDMIKPSRLVMWPEPGRYTILFGVYNKAPAELQTHAESFDTAKFAVFTSTAEFELVGTPPSLIIERGTSFGAVVIYASGTPEDEYRLLWKATLNSSSEHELARFVIPEEGMWAGGFN